MSIHISKPFHLCYQYLWTVQVEGTVLDGLKLSQAIQA